MNKKLLAAAIASVMAAPMAAQALDTKVSGHVNRMIRLADNGRDSDVQFVDNDASNSRFRFNTSGDIGGGITAGIIYEAAFNSNPSAARNVKDGDGGDNAVGMRHSAIYFSGNFGRVDLGHTTEAHDGIAYADLSGTGLGDEVAAGYADGVALSGNAAFNAAQDALLNDGDDDTNPLSVGSTVATTGGGRNDLIKYETPNLGGFGVLRASMSNDSRWGVGAFLGGSAGGGEWQFNAGYGEEGGNDRAAGDSEGDLWGASAAFIFSQGTNIALSYTSSDDGDDSDTTDFYVKLGHKWGNNAASISYGMSDFDNPGNTDAEGSRIGLAFVHTLPQAGIEFYAGYHLYMSELDGQSDPDDVNVFHIGSRIKFN